jgi:hypothetical protein
MTILDTELSPALSWWEHDENSWVAVQKTTAPFFDNPANEFFVASEDFASSLEQVWAIKMGLA